MRLPTAVLAVLAMLGPLALDGCTRTVYYAVMTPQSPRDDGRCFQACQALRLRGAKAYLSCVRSCPRTRVFDEERCETRVYDANRFACTTEQDQTFSPGEALSGIIIGVILFGLIAFIGLAA